MMELFHGQAWRELLHGHILRAPEALGRYKTPLSLQMQLKMQRFSYVIHMAWAEAEKTKPAEAYSCEWQSYPSELVLFGGEGRGGKINILSVLVLSEVSVAEVSMAVHVNSLETSSSFFPPLVFIPLFSPLAVHLVLSNFHACIFSLPLSYINVLLLPTKKLFWLKLSSLWWYA